VFPFASTTVAADEIACDILRFLLANENAMDTARGIAAWWVHKDELAVQPSLHRLVACGAIAAYTLCSGETLYRLTVDPELRSALRLALGVANETSTGSQSPSATQ